MDNAEWLASESPSPMLDYLVAREKPSVRKLRLFACGCVRRVWHLLLDRHSRKAVKTAEVYADERCDGLKLRIARSFAEQALRWSEEKEDKYGLRVHRVDAYGVARTSAAQAVLYCTLDNCLSEDETTWWAYMDAANAYAYDREDVRIRESESCAKTQTDSEYPAARLSEWNAQAQRLRDIFGNPFRPVVFEPAWRTSTVVALAIAAYDNRILPEGTFESERLSILADALEDAGCTEPDILDHLRGPGLHVRGCWAVDLILNKK